MRENAARREVLKQGGWLALLAASALLTSQQARAADPAGFDAKTLDEALKALGGKAAESGDIVITSPDIAENGAVVPVAVTSKLGKTQEIVVLVEKNPFPLTAVFEIPDGTDPYVSTRVKMAESTRIVAVVKADGKLYTTAKETKVTLGGCGG